MAKSKENGERTYTAAVDHFVTKDGRKFRFFDARSHVILDPDTKSCTLMVGYGTVESGIVCGIRVKELGKQTKKKGVKGDMR